MGGGIGKVVSELLRGGRGQRACRRRYTLLDAAEGAGEVPGRLAVSDSPILRRRSIRSGRARRPPSLRPYPIVPVPAVPVQPGGGMVLTLASRAGRKTFAVKKETTNLEIVTFD